MQINLLELIGKERLDGLQQRFFKATGFPNACLDQNGVLLAHAGDTEPFCMELVRKNALGLQRCQDLIKKVQENDTDQNSMVLRCHAGLLDGRIPIRMEQEIVGYLVMGQVLDQPPNKEDAIQYAKELAIDPELYWQALSRVRIIPKEKIESAAQLLEFMGSEIATMASANLRLQQLNQELHQTNTILQQERERFQSLVDNTLDAIFVADDSGHFTMVNRQACMSTGYTEDELLTMHTGEIEIDHTEEEIVEILEKLKQGKAHQTFGIHKRKDGSTFPVETVLGSYMSGNRMNLLAVARDVTERKAAEKEKELLEAKLRQAQKLEAIGTLAGGIAHDFNNILSGILGYTELAINQLERNDITNLDDRLSKIMFGSIRARDLIRQILQFSRKGDRSVSTVKLSSILEEALNLIRSSLPSTIEMKVDIDPDIHARINPTEFHQVAMNLCTNAFQAMRATGGVLGIKLTAIGTARDADTTKLLQPDTSYAELIIEDNGKGISPEIIERIFEPYYTSKKTGEGTGLGLAVVHGLVKGAGGEIYVNSTQNLGTCFKVYLPITEEQDTDTISKNTRQDLPGGTENIVVIDDDASLVEMNSQILGDLGYKIRAFTSSQLALDFIVNNTDEVELIISDMTMPKMTGLELFKKVEKIAPNIPVILYSGYSELISKEEALSMGIKDYLQKPVSIEDLTRSVRSSLDGALWEN